MQSQAATRPGVLAIGLGIALGPVIGQGFARFAYALLLPPMHHDLHWTYAQAGGLHGGNAAGYLVGSAFAAAIARRAGIQNAFIGGLLLTALLILATGLTENFQILLALRFATGVASAVAFIIGSALAAELPPQYTSYFFAGPGVGIFLSGIFVPAVLSNGDDSRWHLGWIILGGVSLLAWIAASKSARCLSPQGGAGHARGLRRAELVAIWPTLASYSLFGAGYAGYMTFVITLLRSQHFAPWVPVGFWLLLGFMATISVFCWRPILERLPGGRGPALMSGTLFLGSIPLLLHASLPMAVISAVLFGGVFLCVVTADIIVARRVLPLEAWTGGMAVLTTGFALGQAVGPVLSGWILDLTGNPATGLWTAPAILLMSGGIALFQANPKDESRRQPTG